MDLPIENIKLKELIQKHSYGNENAFAKLIGINTASINRLFRADNRSGKIPSVLKSTALMKAIENKFPEITSEWFSIVTEKEKQKDNDIINNAIPVDFTEMSVMYVPLVNQYAQAGYLSGFADDEYVGDLPKVPWANDVENKGDYICFEVRGESMDNGSHESYLEGDILLCRNVRQDFWMSKLHINKWDFVIVHKEKGVLVKRIIDHDVEKGVLTLHSLNEYFEDFNVHLNDVAKIFNVVDSKRRRNRR